MSTREILDLERKLKAAKERHVAELRATRDELDRKIAELGGAVAVKTAAPARKMVAPAAERVTTERIKRNGPEPTHSKRILEYLGANPNSTVKQLAEHFGFTYHQADSRIQRMVSRYELKRDTSQQPYTYRLPTQPKTTATAYVITKMGGQIIDALGTGPSTPGEIAEFLGVHHLTVHAELQQMQRAALVTRLNGKPAKWRLSNVLEAEQTVAAE